MTKEDKYVHVTKRVNLEDRRAVIHGIDIVLALLGSGRIGGELAGHRVLAASLEREREQLDWEVHRDERIAHAVARVERNKSATTRVEDEGRMLRNELAATDRELDGMRDAPFFRSPARVGPKFYIPKLEPFDDPNASDLLSSDGPSDLFPINQKDI